MYSTGEEYAFQSAFQERPVVAKVVIKSSMLHEGVAEVCGMAGAQGATLDVSEAFPHMRLSTESDFLSTSVDFPAVAASPIFEVKRDVSFKYSVRDLQDAFRALPSASESYIRINDAGLLSVAHKIHNDDGTEVFVSFFVLANVPDVPLLGGDEQRPARAKRARVAAPAVALDDVDYGVGTGGPARGGGGRRTTNTTRM
jgi:hypothetical protein